MLVIIALFVFTVIGFGLRKIGLITNRGKDFLYRYVYYVAVPAAIIHALATQPAAEIPTYISFLAVNLGTYLALFLMISEFFTIRRSSYKTIGVLRFGSNTPNTVFLGFPLVLALFGQDAFVYAVLLGSLVDAVMNSIRIALISEQRKSSQHTHYARRAKLLLKGLLNPLAVALAIGCVFIVTPLEIPGTIHNILGVVGKTASYAALLVLGASLYGLRIHRKDSRMLVMISTLKLGVMPLMVLGACLLFGLNAEARNASVLVAALPVAVLTLIVAANLKLNEQLAASSILVTTLLSPLSIFIWYFVLNQL